MHDKNTVAGPDFRALIHEDFATRAQRFDGLRAALGAAIGKGFKTSQAEADFWLMFERELRRAERQAARRERDARYFREKVQGATGAREKARRLRQMARKVAA